MLFNTIHIISNFFTFDASGKANGFADEIVHSFNKSEIHVAHKPYSKEVQERKNVILLGDSLGDVGMVQGFAHNVVLKIGFLNGDLAKLEAFKEVYDVVITEDEGVAFVHDIIKSLK